MFFTQTMVTASPLSDVTGDANPKFGFVVCAQLFSGGCLGGEAKLQGIFGRLFSQTPI